MPPVNSYRRLTRPPPPPYLPGRLKNALTVVNWGTIYGVNTLYVSPCSIGVEVDRRGTYVRTYVPGMYYNRSGVRLIRSTRICCGNTNTNTKTVKLKQN